MRFTREELAALHGATPPDLAGPRVRLLFVGINPGLWTAAVQAHFARRGNRFYPALHRAGITDRTIDASAGYRPEDLAHLHERGIGITNLAAHATARADELAPADLVAGAATLADAVVALAGAQLWVAPNPSGLNAHATATSLATAYREIAVAAGIAVLDAPS